MLKHFTFSNVKISDRAYIRAVEISCPACHIFFLRKRNISLLFLGQINSYKYMYGKCP